MRLCHSLKTEQPARWRRHWALVLLAVVLATPGFSSAAGTSDPLLWRVDPSGSGEPVYLFGSLHFGDDSFFPLPARVLEAYRQSDLLAVELDLDSVPREAVQTTTERLGRYPSGTQLSERISPQLWEQLTRAGERLGLEETSIVHLRPWLAALQLVNLQVARSEYQAGQGVDRYFMALARDEKPIESLETLEEQMDLFAGMSEREQSAFLEHTLEDLEATGPQLRRMARAWRNGDREALKSVTLGAFENGDELSERLYERIFVTRNQRMARAVETYLDENRRAFLVVGVGHLLGPDGVVESLRGAGYRVEAL